jgi:hypothetical protein
VIVDELHAVTTCVYELLPMLDTPGYHTLGLEDGCSVAHGFTLLGNFSPASVNSRTWTAQRLRDVWHTPKVLDPEPSQANDFPCISLVIPCFSSRAVSALHDLLEPNGEILPLRCDTGEYFAYNVTTVADVLDRDASVIRWLPGYSLRKIEPIIAEKIEHYEFRSPVRDLAIFRIPENVTGWYVTAVFADRVKAHNLRGFNLRKVFPLPRLRIGGVAEMERRAGLT